MRVRNRRQSPSWTTTGPLTIGRIQQRNGRIFRDLRADSGGGGLTPVGVRPNLDPTPQGARFAPKGGVALTPRLPLTRRTANRASWISDRLSATRPFSRNPSRPAQRVMDTEPAAGLMAPRNQLVSKGNPRIEEIARWHAGKAAKTIKTCVISGGYVIPAPPSQEPQTGLMGSLRFSAASSYRGRRRIRNPMEALIPVAVATAVTAYFEALTEGKQDRWLALFAAAAVVHDPAGTIPGEGDSGLREVWQVLHGPFSTLTIGADDVFYSSSGAAAKWSAVGTGETGSTVEFEGITVFELDDDDKITTVIAYWDPADMMIRLADESADRTLQ